LAVSNVMEGI